MKTRLLGISCASYVFLMLASAWMLTGCGGQPEATPPVFNGDHYAAIVTNAPTQGMPQAGTLALFYYSDGPKGANSLVWPYMTSSDDVVFDRLAVFNGGLSEEVSWKYYPALLAYNGAGNVVEISQPACRKIPDWSPHWTNYAFSVLGMSNDFLRLDASQSGQIETNRPRRLEVDLSKSEIIQAMADAQKNGDAHQYQGVKYFVAP
jgi:hypothetical protein